MSLCCKCGEMFGNQPSTFLALKIGPKKSQAPQKVSILCRDHLESLKWPHSVIFKGCFSGGKTIRLGQAVGSTKIHKHVSRFKICIKYVNNLSDVTHFTVPYLTKFRPAPRISPALDIFWKKCCHTLIFYNSIDGTVILLKIHKTP